MCECLCLGHSCKGHPSEGHRESHQGEATVYTGEGLLWCLGRASGECQREWDRAQHAGAKGSYHSLLILSFRWSTCCPYSLFKAGCFVILFLGGTVLRSIKILRLKWSLIPLKRREWILSITDLMPEKHELVWTLCFCFKLFSQSDKIWLYFKNRDWCYYFSPFWKLFRHYTSLCRTMP